MVLYKLSLKTILTVISFTHYTSGQGYAWCKN